MSPGRENLRLQLACAWLGPVFVVLFAIGLVPLAQLVPPPSPSASAHSVATMYRDHITGIRVGLVTAMVATALLIPWATTIAMWTRRIEGAFPFFTYMQVACIGLGVCITALTMLVWSVAAFRPDMAPDTLRLLNDTAWFLYLYSWPPFGMWGVAIGVAILRDGRERPLLPRWAGYYNFWFAAGMSPASLIIFYKTGPFAFDGLMGFWVVNVAAFGWIVVMSVCVIRALNAELRADTQTRQEPSAGPRARVVGSGVGVQERGVRSSPAG